MLMAGSSGKLSRKPCSGSGKVIRSSDSRNNQLCLLRIMKVLFIGGTGVISSACTELAVARGFELTLLNRGQRGAWSGARQLTADITNPAAAAAALGREHWDA